MSTNDTGKADRLGSWWAWAARHPKWFTRPWVVIGKGPSFDSRNKSAMRGLCKLGLNHIAREMHVTAAHVIDVDVIGQCSPEVWLRRCEVLVMPWHPHVKCRPTEKTLDDFVDEHRVLECLAGQGRLLWYNLSTARPPGWHRPNSRIVDVLYFSSEAAIRLLAMAGCREVFTVGIDGGTEYAKSFANLAPLTNTQSAFDVQFDEIEKIVEEYGVSVSPLKGEAA